MDFEDSASAQRVTVERLGVVAGRKFAAMARRGFRLERPSDEAAATGRCRLGGPALLEAGTPWPQAGGVPLSLHAVLDTDALAPWLGSEMPTRPGLLNFFYLDPDVPYEQYQTLDHSGPETCRVISADPTRAIETAAPAPARIYPAAALHAVERIALPDCWDVGDGDVEFDRTEHWGAQSLILAKMGDLDGNTAGQHYAFGWPDTSYTVPVTRRDAEGPAIHLLQLAEDAELGWGWGDAGTIYFTIPARDFASGNYGEAVAEIICC